MNEMQAIVSKDGSLEAAPAAAAMMSPVSAGITGNGITAALAEVGSSTASKLTKGKHMFEDSKGAPRWINRTMNIGTEL